MVMRYFGNKDQLFAAAADFDLQILDLAGVARDQVGARVVDYFMERWERDEALIVLLRSSTSNADAAQRMQEIFAGQLLPRSQHQPGGSLRRQQSRRRCWAWRSRLHGLVPIVEMSHEEIVAWLGPTIQRYLDE